MFFFPSSLYFLGSSRVNHRASHMLAKLSTIFSAPSFFVFVFYKQKIMPVLWSIASKNCAISTGQVVVLSDFTHLAGMF
jgi:hypothetical protein